MGGSCQVIQAFKMLRYFLVALALTAVAASTLDKPKEDAGLLDLLLTNDVLLDDEHEVGHDVCVEEYWGYLGWMRWCCSCDNVDTLWHQMRVLAHAHNTLATMSVRAHGCRNIVYCVQQRCGLPSTSGADVCPAVVLPAVIENRWCNHDKVMIPDMPAAVHQSLPECIHRCRSNSDCKWVGFRTVDSYCEYWAAGSCANQHYQSGHNIYHVAEGIPTYAPASPMGIAAPCHFTTGDGTGGHVTRVTTTGSEAACAQYVRQFHPSANGATWGVNSNYCYAEFGMTGQNSNTAWRTCSLPSAEEDMQQTATVGTRCLDGASYGRRRLR